MQCMCTINSCSFRFANKTQAFQGGKEAASLRSTKEARKQGVNSFRDLRALLFRFHTAGVCVCFTPLSIGSRVALILRDGSDRNTASPIQGYAPPRNQITRWSVRVRSKYSSSLLLHTFAGCAVASGGDENHAHNKCLI